MPLKKRLLVGPAVPNQQTLAHLVGRLGHYLAHVNLDSIVIAVTPELARSGPGHIVSDPDLPTGFDSDVARRVAAVSRKISLRTVDSVNPHVSAEFLLLWDVRAKVTEPWRSVARNYRQNRTLFDVDWQRTRTDGSWFGELAMVLSKRSRAFDQAESERFRARTDHLLESSTAYLVATGPSARGALDVELDDGVRIACNTTILDDELMAHVRPQIVTFADPIFHFGPSTYAHRFQRALGRLAVRQDFTVVTLERYAALLRDRLPQLADRIVGVRLGPPSWPQNYDLRSELAVKPYPNILTMLMIPLAATFAPSVELFGFDGRNPQDSYFWQHGPSVQFNEELEDIKHVHPGFFELAYDDYYDQHVAAVEQMFLDIELRGCNVTPRTSSFMRPLRRRAGGRSTTQSLGVGGSLAHRRSAGLILSITPDWTGDFGHFGPWERSVGAAARGRGFNYRSLASWALEAPDDNAIPAFTHGTLHREAANATLFEHELRNAITATAGDTPAIVCMYVADVWHLPALLEIAMERPTSTFVVNLMRSHIEVGRVMSSAADPSSSLPMQLLSECLDVSRGTNVHICLDSEAIISDVEMLVGHRPLEWPMVMLTDPVMLHAPAPAKPHGPLRLVAPVHAQVAKGFAEVVELAERLSDSPRSESLVLVARHAPQPQGTNPALELLADRFCRAGGQLVKENLSDSQYAALVAGADVIVLPYRLATFRTRTSGVVLDALAAGKPSIAVGGTWAGTLVERAAIGTTYDDGSVDSLELAVHSLLSDLDRYRRNAEHARSRLLVHYRPERLVAFLARLAGSRNPPPDPARVCALRPFARLASKTFWEADAVRDEERLRHLVIIDNLQRARDDLADEVALHRATNAWRQRHVDRLKPSVSRSAPPKRDPPVRTHTPRDIGQNVYDREDHAHLDELELVANLVVPERTRGGVMVDVGAHHGSAFRRFHKAGWTVHAFEPDPRHFAYLSERHSGDDRLVLDNRGVSNVTGEKVEFFVSDESTGISGLSAFRDSHFSIGEVETVALRDIPSLDRVDLLKIDTEGYEKFVLEGYPWERVRPAVVVAEFEDRKTNLLGYTTDYLIGCLRDRGYETWVSEWHPIVRYGIRHQWRRLVGSDDYCVDPASWGNLIAFDQPIDPGELGRALAKVVTFGVPG